ncbi:hypothetical protein PLESTF_000332900 [Pleodorina starrii]|nr:hypothetical protein PLESTF_000332900 [Pleodorina starrii]
MQRHQLPARGGGPAPWVAVHAAVQCAVNEPMDPHRSIHPSIDPPIHHRQKARGCVKLLKTHHHQQQHPPTDICAASREPPSHTSPPPPPARAVNARPTHPPNTPPFTGSGLYVDNAHTHFLPLLLHAHAHKRNGATQPRTIRPTTHSTMGCDPRVRPLGRPAVSSSLVP